MLETHTATVPSSTNRYQGLEAVYRGRPTYEFREGYDFHLNSRDVWVVCRGIVQLSSIHSNGNEAFLGLIFPNMPFGLPLTRLEPYIAISLCDVVVMRLSVTDLEQSSELSQEIFGQLNRRLQQTEELLALINQRPLCYRLQLLLLLLAREVGQATPDGIRIWVRLTHRQLAELMGTNRISVTRLMKFLRQEGWLSTDRTNHLVVHGSEAFEF